MGIPAEDLTDDNDGHDVFGDVSKDKRQCNIGNPDEYGGNAD